MSDETTAESPAQAFPNFPLNITIKQEKQSPKRTNETHEPAGETSNGIFAFNHEDSKGSLTLDPPLLKSSDEILAELFGVFNAAPPDTLLKDGKYNKKKKKDKKKHKKTKIKTEPKSDDEGQNSGKSSNGTTSGSEAGEKNDADKSSKKKKHKKSREGSVDSKGEKKKKKHKHKHKKHKIKKEKKSDTEEADGKEKKESTEKELKRIKKEKTSDAEDGEIKESSKHKQKSREKSKDRDKKDVKEKPKIQIKSLANSTVLKEALRIADERHKDREHSSRKRKKSESDISLSDEDEDFMTSKKLKNPYARPIKSEVLRPNKFYDGYYESYRHERRHSRDRSYRRSRDRSYDRSHSRYRRSRSRSRSSNRLDIDKKQLLDIARKNAIQMLKTGTLPGVQNLTQEIKDKLLNKVKYGGKSVAELTDYCKKLSNGEIGESDISDNDSETEERAFHHPFELKDRGPIVMNIKNATPIPPKSAQEKKELLKLFPVSSGQEHRASEHEWVPVEPTPPQTSAIIEKKSHEKLQALMPAPTATAVIPLQAPQPQAPPKNLAPVSEVTIPSTVPEVQPVPPPPPVPQMPINETDNQINLEIANSWKSSDFGFQNSGVNPTDSIHPQVFASHAHGENLDVNQIISNRLDAMRRLQENPNDHQAAKVLEDTQKNMSAWASSKYTPGQFLGSTGATLLSAKELAGWGGKAYARKDTLTSTQPVNSGMGMHLLQKMGWRPGEGLGKDKSGSLQPLLLEVKHDRKGLVAGNENTRMKPPRRPLRMSLEGKHPVSLLGELSSKRKWGTPQYEVALEQGPGHAKLFVYKVRVNGMEYQPAIASNTKKEGKAVAAKFCLQQMGILPT